ncbi:MAG: class I SAM-dependent methyltransferase [Actinobacteria bacterium]|nr:class I SAM-dependent methyltransferase [Actinomycetota bacterium]
MPETWHHGVIARYWAEFNTEGPEIEFFRRFIEDGGGPALDVACGTGRLLIPWLEAGLDVDGVDVSEDMLALCRERAEREGLTARLYAQPMHEVDLPRRYRTIVVCGGLGVGSSRDRDLQVLRRLHHHLEPGGTVVLDNEVPYASPRLWPYWTAEGRSKLPEEWRPPGERRRGSDGTEYELRSRCVSLNPLEQSATLEMEARMWSGGELAAEETHSIDLMFYFRDELVLMLERAGFRDVSVRRGYDDAPAGPEDEFLVFSAKK